MKKYLLTFVALVCSLMVSAYDFGKDLIYYTITSETDLTVEVTSGVEYKGVVNIPSTVVFGGQTYNVTRIGELAFENCYSLTSVTIPAGVTSIGAGAFCACSSLTSLTLPAGVTSIGGYAFCACSSLTSLTLPAGVTSIGERAFERCSSLTSVTLPAGVTSIGAGAFNDCSSLTSVTIPAGVTSIGNSTFSSCSSLTSVTLPAGVTSIGEWAFFGCSSLTSLTLPAGLTSIGNYAFSDCEDLTSVIVGNAMPLALESNVFSNRSNAVLYVPAGSKAAYESASVWSEFKEIVENITFADSKVKEICVANWDTNGDGELSPSEAAAVTSIGQIFNGNAEITSFDELQYFTSVETLTDGAFSGCSSLTSITLPVGVTSIGESAFNGCFSLTSVTLPAGLTSIGGGAFRGCSSLTSVTLPAGVTSIGRAAFVDCSSLTSVTLPAGVTSIGEWAFEYCSSLTSVTIPNSVTSIGNSTFSGCSSLTSLTLPAGLTSIGGYAFYGCSSLTSVTIPAGVTSIGAGAFSGCSSLTSVTIPAGVTSIGNSTFSGCSSLTSVTIPAGVMSIGDYAFEGCSSLTSVTIPESVTSIGKRAFDGCSSLTSVTLPAGVTSIGNSTFSGCSSLTSVTIPESVTSIGERAFCDCSSLTSVTIPAGVTSIGAGAFVGCYNLKTVINLSALDIVKGTKTYGWVALYADKVLSLGESFYFWQGAAGGAIEKGGVATGHGACEGRVNYANGDYYTLSVSGKKANIDTDYILITLDQPLEANDKLEITAYRNKDTDANGTLYILFENGQAIDEGGEVVWNNVALGQEPNTNSYNVGKGAGSKTIKLSRSAASTNVFITKFVITRSANTSNITFADSKVKEICVANWDTNGDGELSLSEAAAVTSISPIFRGKEITSFNELQYFTSVETLVEFAFSGCSSLTRLTLPAGVTSIGGSAFSSCSSLTSVTIPESVTSIGDQAFCDCSSLTSITLPAGLTSIGEMAFYYCSSLTSVTLPAGVTSIGESAFCGCSSLTSVTLPESVTSIGDGAFFGCSSLTSITLPAGVTSIGDGAFWGCSSLTSITLPAGVTSIGDQAFFGCSSLTSVTLPAGVTSIGEMAFWCCDNLKTVINFSALDIVKGSDTHGFVAYYADKVLTPGEAFYSWQGAAGGAAEKGGVASGHGACEGRVNYANGDYYTLGVSGKKAYIDTDYILITLDQPLEANDKLEITAYRNKDTDANGTLYILFENGQAIDEGGEVVWNNVALGQEPNTNSYNVGGGAGSKTIKLSRSATSTNVFITKFLITRSANGLEEVVDIVVPTENLIYNLQGQKLNTNSVDELPRGLYIINGKKVLVK